MFSVRVLVRDIREEFIVFVLRMLPFTIQYMHHIRGHNISLIYKTKNYISVMIMLVPEYSCTKLRRVKASFVGGKIPTLAFTFRNRAQQTSWIESLVDFRSYNLHTNCSAKHRVAGLGNSSFFLFQ